MGNRENKQGDLSVLSCYLQLAGYKKAGNIRFFPVGGKLTGDCKFYLPRQGMLVFVSFRCRDRDSFPDYQ